MQNKFSVKVGILAQGGHSASEQAHFRHFQSVSETVFFGIFCKPHTYSHPFLTTLVSFKKIWPIYGYGHFLEAKKLAKLASNLK